MAYLLRCGITSQALAISYRAAILHIVVGLSVSMLRALL